MRAGFAATVLLLSVATVAAQESADLTFVLAPGEDPAYAGSPGLARLVAWTPGENVTWEVEVTDAYVVADVRVADGTFDVARPGQLLPEYDDASQHPDADHLHPHFFQIVPHDPAGATAPARVVHYTLSDDGFTARLGLTGPGKALLHMRRDVSPPAFTIGPPQNVTERGFVLTTTTDEFAYADLRIRPAAGGDEVENPTAIPALEQTFPVQGLEPDTPYVYRVVFEDWSGNVAESETVAFTTPPAPRRPPPVVLGVDPASNATVPAAAGIEVVVRSPEAPIAAGGVRLFVDKKEVSEGVEVRRHEVLEDAWTVRWAPEGGLRPGHHSASVEVRNEAGGEAVARWSFRVEQAMPITALEAVAAVGAALVLRPRR